MNDEILSRDTCSSTSGQRLRGCCSSRPGRGTLSGKLTTEWEPQDAASGHALSRAVHLSLSDVGANRTLYRWQMISRLFRLDIKIKTQQGVFLYATLTECVLNSSKQSART